MHPATIAIAMNAAVTFPACLKKFPFITNTPLFRSARGLSPSVAIIIGGECGEFLSEIKLLRGDYVGIL